MNGVIKAINRMSLQMFADMTTDKSDLNIPVDRLTGKWLHYNKIRQGSCQSHYNRRPSGSVLCCLMVFEVPKEEMRSHIQMLTSFLSYHRVLQFLELPMMSLHIFSDISTPVPSPCVLAGFPATPRVMEFLP